MHELALAQRVAHAALEALAGLDPPPRRVVRTVVVAGRLHQIVPDFLTRAFGYCVEGTPAQGSGLDLEIVPVTARCPACGWTGEIEPPWFVCGDCGRPGVEVRTGKEFYLDRLEVERDDD